MDYKGEVETPKKNSINFKLSNPFFIGGIVTLVLLVICMFVYVFSDDKDSKNGILTIATVTPSPVPDTYEQPCETVSDCVGTLPESFNDEQIDCLNTEEPYCLFGNCLYTYKEVGEECGVDKKCNSNRECKDVNIDLTNCRGDKEIFMPFHEWVNTLGVHGDHIAGGDVTDIFNREIDKMVEFELDYHNKPLGGLTELRESSDEVKHGQIALARYMLKDINNISNEVIATTITGGWDDYNDLLDVSQIGFNADSTTITKIEVDYCSEIPPKNNFERFRHLSNPEDRGEHFGSFPLYDLFSSRLNTEGLRYWNELIECGNKIKGVDDNTIKEQNCTTYSTDDITCQYDQGNNTCLPTTSTPDFFDTTELANSLQNFDHCKAYYSSDGYNCIEDERSFLSFNGLLHVCKNDDKCV